MKAKQLKNAVLQFAIQGKLAPQDPLDESASVLLDSIKEEKMQLINEKKIKREKSMPEISDAEKPFDIPDSWEWVRLGNVIQLISGQDMKPSDYSDNKDGIPYITGASNILNGKLLINRWTNNPKSIALKGDLLLTCKGTVGTTTIQGEAETHIARQIMSLRTWNWISNRYLKLFIDSYVIELKTKAKSMIPGIARDDVLSIAFPLPPLAEQQRIVSKIEAMIPLIDKYEKLELELSKLEDDFPKNLKKSILKYAIQGRLVEQNKDDEPASLLLEQIKAEKEQLIYDKKIKKEKTLGKITAEEKPFDIPSTWEWVRIVDITSKLGSGSTPTGGRNVYSADGIKFIRSQNVYNDGLRLSDIAYISEDINNRKKGSIVHAQDVLLNITGGSIGRCALVPDNFNIANVNQHVMIIRLVEKRTRQYIHYCLISNYIQEMIMDVQVGVSREGLSATKLSNFPIPLPPLEEQQRIVARVDALMDLCDLLDVENALTTYKITSKVTKIIEFKPQLQEQEQEYIEDFDMVARAESISPETQAKMDERINLLRHKR